MLTSRDMAGLSLELFEKMGTLSLGAGLLLKHFRYDDLRSDNWLFSAYMFFLLWWLIWPVLGGVEVYERIRKYRAFSKNVPLQIGENDRHLYMEHQPDRELKPAVL
jgi:hypothetical protein